MDAKFNDLIGAVLKSVVGLAQHSEEVLFTTENGRCYRMFHYQDCCEQVDIAEVIGNPADLIGSEILFADELSNEGAPKLEGQYVESYTWTFYRIGTEKGEVVIRWLGQSNGYYSERVDFEEVL